MRGTTGKDMIRCGDLWNQAKENDKAKAAWSRALDFRGSESEANSKLAEYAKTEGNFGKARELYIEALKNDTSSLVIFENLSKLEEKDEKDLKSALSYAEKALEILGSMADPDDFSLGQKRHELNNRISRLRKKCLEEA